MKAASDLYSPLAGVVVESNAALDQAPETVNQEPYGAGWLIRLKPDNIGDSDGLLDAAAYSKLIG